MYALILVVFLIGVIWAVNRLWNDLFSRKKRK